MRHTFLTLVIAVASILGLGCEEEIKPSKVVGEIHFSGQQCGDDFENIDGTLAQGGATYYGYCTKSGDDLEFTVATQDRAKATNSTDFYLLVKGVKGPPVEGVNGANGQPKEDDANYTTFQSVLFKNVNEYSFEYEDPNDFQDGSNGNCRIVLFAKPIEGELNPNKQKFDYYVEMDCGALEAETNTDSSIVLNYMEFYFYLSDC
jgi:hypothetical protein